MRTLATIAVTLTAVYLCDVSSALAESVTDAQVREQADVWAQIERQWAAEEKGDDKWLDTVLTDDFSGWGKGTPAPRGKASTKMWNRFNEQISVMVAHELYPLSIVVHDNVAVAHYLYTSASKSKNEEGTIKTTNGRYTDILVRTDDGWKFLAWSGGDD